MRLSHGSYGVFVTIMGSTWLLHGAHANHVLSATYDPVTAA